MNYRYVSIPIAILLLFAVVLKIHQEMTVPAASTDFLTSSWIALAVVVLELGLGLWLLVGFHPVACKWATFVVFACYLGVSLFRTAANEVSCGCFGVLSVRPWQMAIIDLLVLAALAFTRPEAPNPTKYSRHAISACVLVCAAFGIAGSIRIAMSGPPILVAFPEVLEFGILGRGKHTNRPFWITNPGVVPIEISSFRSSCPCATVNPEAATILPGATVSGRVHLDMISEPNFTGNLRIEMQGMTTNGTLGVSFSVKARISAEPGEH